MKHNDNMGKVKDASAWCNCGSSKPKGNVTTTTVKTK